MVVISGPSGSGKSTICKRLLEDPRVVFSVSATTRPKRAGEVDGRDYHFLSREEFRRRLEGGEFIEHAEVFGNLYGTLRAPMQAALARGETYLLEIDVQGALQLKALGEPGVYVFVAPPDFEELRRRLVRRGTEAPEVIERRLHKAEDEYRERVKYDHVVVNDDLDRAVARIRQIVGLDVAPPEPRAANPATRRPVGGEGSAKSGG
jgi:guanylate kinase